ncbi:MAG TPA: UxaA family hydrolase [Baekduia sp.]
MSAALTGFVRDAGRPGVRNHVLVLPSVVCSSHSALEIAGEDGAAIAITHQHGCLHVGDDLVHTEGELVGTATNPNVAGVVVVSLGCETINGARLAREIAARGQRVELVGIQAAGGTRHAIAEGRAAVARLSATAGERTPLAPEELVVGLDAADDPLAEPLRAALAARGVTVLPLPDGPRGAEAHVALAGAGAQLIVSLPVPDEAPIGFAVCPVVAVGRETELHLALADDFDVHAEAGETAEALADRVAERVLTHAAGEQTASERRGARDFVLHRLAVTM